MKSAHILVSAAALVFASAAGCSSDGDGDGSGGSGGGTSGGCWPSAELCYVAGPNGPGAECLAKHDNSGSNIWQGRLSQIQVLQPAALATTLVQGTIIDTGVSLAQPECYEEGDGTFIWLFEFNSETGILKTGGGEPPTDPKAGSCFISLPNASLPTEPIEVQVDINEATREFSAQGIDVVVPIFLDPADLTKVVLLPLHEVAFGGQWNGDDHNCIGKFNGDTLEPVNLCKPDTRSDPEAALWTNGGHLEGYITIAEAEQVVIDDLNTTLCILLAGNDYADDAKLCRNAANEPPTGDWCSQTNSAADANCADAYKLAADFAASAFKINGNCQ